MPQLNSYWTREAQRVKPDLPGLPIRSAIEIRKQIKPQQLKEELGSQPFYIAPTRTQSGRKINTKNETARDKKSREQRKCLAKDFSKDLQS